MAPFSDFDAALPYVAEMPKTLASSSSELAQRVDTPRGDRSERGKVGGPQPAPALVGGVVTVGRRQMCRGVVGGARTRTRGFAPLRQLRGSAVRSSTLFGLWVWFHADPHSVWSYRRRGGDGRAR